MLEKYCASVKRSSPNASNMRPATSASSALRFTPGIRFIGGFGAIDGVVRRKELLIDVFIARFVYSGTFGTEIKATPYTSATHDEMFEGRHPSWPREV